MRHRRIEEPAMHAFAAFSPFAARLRQARWTDQFLQAYLIFLGACVLRFALPDALGHALRPFLFVAPLLPLIAKDLAHFPDALARTRAAVRARTWRALPAAWLPPELVGLIRLDRALRRGFVGWLLRRPRAAQPAGRSFTYLERGSYRTACAILLVSCLLELPIDAAIVQLAAADHGARLSIHLLMLAGALSSIAYMLGDRWLIGAGEHVLTEQGLELRIGARTHATIPLQAIAACERIDEPAAAWLRRHGVNPRQAVRASPFDKPNAVLRLQPDNKVPLNHMGVERSDVSCIFLYLDRPQELIHALAPH
jgi:hypothetical protein